jgi:pilus assembly protein Flp/PilA
MSMFRKFLADEGGATAIEYSMIAACISIAIVAGARAIGVNLSASMFGPVASNLN